MTPFTIEKMALLAPMPRANVSSATTVNDGLLPHACGVPGADRRVTSSSQRLMLTGLLLSGMRRPLRDDDLAGSPHRVRFALARESRRPHHFAFALRAVGGHGGLRSRECTDRHRSRPTRDANTDGFGDLLPGSPQIRGFVHERLRIPAPTSQSAIGHWDENLPVPVGGSRAPQLSSPTAHPVPPNRCVWRNRAFVSQDPLILRARTSRPG